MRLLPLVLVVAGCGFLFSGLRARRLPSTEAGALAAVAGLVALSAVSLLATRLELYRPWLAAALGAAVLSAAGFALHHGRQPVEGAERAAAPQPTLRGEGWILLSLVSALGLLYGLFPTYFLFGGQDPGLYLVFAAHIARTGGLVLDLPVLRELHAAFGEAVTLGYPGIYSAYDAGLSRDPAALVPQFVHLFPALLANAWSAFGLEGAARANAVVTAVGLAAFFGFSRRLLGPGLALLATSLLGVNPALVWHARTTLTEPLLLALTFGGLLLMVTAMDRRSATAGFVAGALLGIGVFDRLDGSIAVVTVGGTVAAAALATSAHAAASSAPSPAATPTAPALRPAFAMMLGYAIYAGLAALDAWLFSRPYVEAAWAAGALKGLLALNVALLTAALLIVVAAPHRASLLARRERGVVAGRKRRAGSRRRLARHEPPRRVWLATAAAVVTGAGLVAWLGYGFLLRPFTEATNAGRAVVEMSWYVTPLALVACAGGIAWAVRAEPWERWAGWLLLATFTLLLFSWRLLIDPQHPWSARRWVPVVFPAVAFFSAYVIARTRAWAADAMPAESDASAGRGATDAGSRGLARRGTTARWRGSRRPTWAATAVTVVAVGFVMLYLANALDFARSYLLRPMLGGLAEGYTALARQLDERDTHLTWNQHVASVLTYLYERPTIHVDRFAKGMERYPIVGPVPGKSWGRALALSQDGFALLCGPYVEEEAGRRPRRIVERCEDASPFRIAVLAREGAAPGGPRVRLRPGSTVFRSVVGRPDSDGRLRATGEGGWLVRGPDVSLPSGRYRASWTGRVEEGRAESSPAAWFLVEADGRQSAGDSLVVGPQTEGLFQVALDFQLPEGARSVEFPVRVVPRVEIRLDEFALEPSP